MERLLARQEETGKEIQRIITNYKKDSQSRKSEKSYYEDRLRRLENAWTSFEETHQEILGFEDLPADHPYFVSKYYQGVLDLYRQYRNHFLEQISRFENTQEQATALPASPALPLKGFTGAVPKAGQAQVTTEPCAKASTQHELCKLIRRQQAVADALCRLLDTIKMDDTVHPKAYYELSLQTINQYWVQLQEYHFSIWESSEDPNAAGYNMQLYMELEDRVRQCLVYLSTKGEESSSSPCAEMTQRHASPMLKLPKIVLPRFDGDYLKWQQFQDLFTQMVHNQAIPSCQKMWYLKTNLTGEAEKLIRHFSLSNENYDSAWQMLQDRYQNPRLLVAALINKLLLQSNHTGDHASASSIKALHDTTKECLMGLQNLGVPTSNWDPLLLHILIKKLDKATHALYEQTLANPRELQSIEEFLLFLETRFQSLEALGTKTKALDEPTRRSQSIKSLASVAAPRSACVLCKEDHQLFACRAFLNLSPHKRLDLAYKHNLCINCLKAGHGASTCLLRGCTKCNRRHNSLLHIGTSGRRESLRTSQAASTNRGTMSASQPSAGTQPTQSSPTAAAVTNRHPHGYILLATAIVKIRDLNGRSMECRAILDSGSQVNLVTDRLVRKLGLTASLDSMYIQGIGKGRQQARRRVNCLMESRLNGFSARLEAFALPQIVPSQPTLPLDVTTWPIPANIQLADPNFHRPGQIDLLLGAEFYHQLLAIGQIKLSNNLPILQNTVLGWIVSGKIEQTPLEGATCGICNEDLDQSIGKFWEMEEVDTSQTHYTVAESRCETHFTQTVQRSTNGRFIVRLPFADSPDRLGESKEIAMRRFLALERRFSRYPELKRQYTDFMEEYLTLGHMEEAPAAITESKHYYLPHHCVMKPDSSTTKLRVVFDGSAKTSTNVSLNDILYSGPTIQDDLFSILLRFRIPRYVFTADIQKMYRQVLLQPEDRRYQLILWRSDSRQPVKSYQLATVTYGTTSAPYLATKCLQKLAQEGRNRYPLGSKVLLRDFYVDDTMTGCDSLVETIETQKQLISLLKEGGFTLRKWCANHPRLLQDIRAEDQEVQLDFSNEVEERIKALGLLWFPKSDQFCVRVGDTEQRRITKRTVASSIAQLFDPLGFMAPVVIVAKVFLQELWQLKLDWDAALPMELHSRWLRFREGLQALNNIQVPRHACATEVPRGRQLHVFADASEKAYGAVVYLRTVTQQGRIIVRLLCAKSRVAPIKTITIPRLELCAARLATQLAHRVKEDLGMEEVCIQFWTDSEIVLAWINSTSSSFTPFVANRIATIQRMTLAEQWRHVGSKDNPADVLSRGITPEKLGTHHLWFHGPTFLHGKESTWPPIYNKARQVECTAEKKRTALPVTATNETDSSRFLYNINHGNSFRRLQRITAYSLRFIKRIRQGDRQHKTQSHLTSKELEEALQVLIKTMQESDFHTEIVQLKKCKEVPKDSPLSTLSPFLDERGILRVGGRLEESNLSYDSKHQILLPYSHQWTKLLMTAIHEENLHVNPQALLSTTRQRFWPIRGKILARSIVQHCVRCNRAKPKMLSQMMGSLPSTRVQPARPFVNAGVDFWGPMWIHYRLRGKRPQKCYAAVFCCFATKAVHLEVVSDLTTEAFLGCLRRFISRRGHCRNLYCDNATNFVGAKNQLQELYQVIYTDQAKEKIMSACTSKGIDFHFIPPRAPHFGGLWEAAVKSAKHLLLKNVSPANLTYEELETMIVEIEAILNSRPLTAMSANPNDPSALTPGHFLIGEALTAQIDPDAEPLKASLPRRWKLVTQLKRQFWNRWSNEYLKELQHRYKWKQRCQNLEPGAIVIIQDDNLPVMKWPLGRVLQTFRGKDDCIRVVDVKTASGILRRPVHKLSPLPIEDCPVPEVPASQVSQSTHGTTAPKCDVWTKKQAASNNTSQATGSTSSRSPEQPTRKKLRANCSSAILNLLLVCLILPIKGDVVEVTKFDAQPSLHFEELGTTHLISNEWRLVVYYDLAPYWTEVAALRNGTLALRHLCDQIRLKNSCSQVISQLEHIQIELSNGNELLTEDGSANRLRRGALNIVGKVANSLFGILDNDYAQEMAQTIDAVKENEDHLIHLLRNQTSVVDSTINILKQDFEAIDKKFQFMERLTTEIINRIHDTGKEEYQLRMAQLFNSLSTILILTANNLQRVQSSIIDTLTEIHHGKISTLILSPHQLMKEMFVIRTHLPSSLRLPAIDGNIAQIYRLMTVRSRVTDKYVIFQLTMPLVGWEHYNLLRILPIPVWINNTFVAITPSCPLLAVNAFRDHYYPMTELELQACESFNNTIHLCKQSRPIYHQGSDVCACEISLLRNLPSDSSCKLAAIGKTPIWTQLSHTNQWIYALSTKTSTNVVCRDGTFPLTLEGSGLVRMNADCAIKQDLVTIQGHPIYSSNTRVSFTKMGTVTNITIPVELSHMRRNDTRLHLQLENLEGLQKRITKENLELPRQIASQAFHHHAVSYTGLLLAVAILLFLICKFLHQLQCCRKKPIPQPRQHRAQDTQDFTIQV